MNLIEKEIKVRKLQSDENSVIVSKAIDSLTELPEVVTQEAYITSSESPDDYEEKEISEMLSEIDDKIAAMETQATTFTERENSEEYDKTQFILDKYAELQHRLNEWLI